MRKVTLLTSLVLIAMALPVWATAMTYVQAKAWADRDEASVPKD